MYKARLPAKSKYLSMIFMLVRFFESYFMSHGPFTTHALNSDNPWEQKLRKMY